VVALADTTRKVNLDQRCVALTSLNLNLFKYQLAANSVTLIQRLEREGNGRKVVVAYVSALNCTSKDRMEV
jgi:hypothetical protein